MTDTTAVPELTEAQQHCIAGLQALAGRIIAGDVDVVLVTTLQTGKGIDFAVLAPGNATGAELVGAATYGLRQAERIAFERPADTDTPLPSSADLLAARDQAKKTAAKKTSAKRTTKH